MPTELRTARLWLRRWTPADREPFAAMNADPEVMRHFPAPLSRAESDAFADRIEERFAAQGWGLWALSAPVGSGLGFAGFVGLNPVPPELPAAPGVEIGWRLARPAWGHGYATEAARAVVQFAFTEAGLDELVSFTAAGNERSQAVMRRIGMTRDRAGDFDHPLVPAHWPGRRSVLYRLRRQKEPA